MNVIKSDNKKLPPPGIEPGFAEPQSAVITTILR